MRLAEPIRVYRKTDTAVCWTIEDQDGNPFNLSGADEVEFIVTWNNEVLFVKSLGSGVTILDPAGGVLDVIIPNSDVDISAGVYDFELAVTDQGGARMVADQGDFVVEHSYAAMLLV